MLWGEPLCAIGSRTMASDFTYVATWKGFVYVAPRHGHSDQWRSHGSIIDAYARKIVGWRVSSSARAGFALDALEQVLHDRRPGKGMGLVRHGDRGSQYCLSATLNVWGRPGSTPRWAASATVTTTPWPRRSMACSRLRSSTAAARGAAWKPWKMRRSNGLMAMQESPAG